MCVERNPPGEACRECGQRDELTFYITGFVRSVTRHKCTRPVPGPPAPPVLYPEHAQQKVDPGYHASFTHQPG